MGRVRRRNAALTALGTDAGRSETSTGPRRGGALGGRLGALRREPDLEATVRRNIFHEEPPSESAVKAVSAMLQEFRERLAAMPAAQILEGELPQL